MSVTDPLRLDKGEMHDALAMNGYGDDEAWAFADRAFAPYEHDQECDEFGEPCICGADDRVADLLTRRTRQ